MATIGEKIRQLRRQRGMTQSELGLGIVSASMMSQIESGRTRPSYTLLKSIANKLDVPVEFFLDDFEDHFATSARLQLAEYWLLTGKYDTVLNILGDMEIPEPPGADYFLYRFLLARVYRAQGNYHSAVETLEELREYGLKTIDRRILFLVMKESGYVEEALGNPIGAKHEWRMALDTGKSVSAPGSVSLVYFKGEMAEICYRLYLLSLQANQPEDARQYLLQAEEFSAKQSSYSEIAAALVEDALACIEEDSGHARSLIETAVNLLNYATFVQQHIMITTQMEKALRENVDDPWDAAAKATVQLHPERFIQGEIQRIQGLLESGQTGFAFDRIERCFDIIADYQQEDDSFSQRIQQELIQLRLAEAEAHFQRNELQETTALLTGLLHETDFAPYRSEQLKAYHLLLKSLHTLGDGKRVYDLENELKDFLLTD